MANMSANTELFTYPVDVQHYLISGIASTQHQFVPSTLWGTHCLFCSRLPLLSTSTTLSTTSISITFQAIKRKPLSLSSLTIPGTKLHSLINTGSQPLMQNLNLKTESTESTNYLITNSTKTTY